MYSETKNILYNTESVGVDLFFLQYSQTYLVHEVWVIDKSSIFLVMFWISEHLKLSSGCISLWFYTVYPFARGQLWVQQEIKASLLKEL